MIPVIINNRDRLGCTRKLVDDILLLDGVGEVKILDNASSYPPLLEWYDKECPVEVIRLNVNLGPRSPWDSRSVPTNCYYVVTDSDMGMEDTPSNILQVLRHGLDEYPWAIKAGANERLDDLPDTDRCRRIKARMAEYWQEPLLPFFHKADVDTTFAMYRPNSGWGGYGPAIRSNHPWVVRHVNWYYDENTLPEDERYYVAHTPKSFGNGIAWSQDFRHVVGVQ